MRKYKNWRNPNTITESMKDRIAELYIGGNSSVKTALISGVSQDSVTRICKERGVPIRGYKESAKRFNINHHYFDVIDTEDKAYWLGFICSDGNVSGNSVKIMLKKSDLAHLYKFKKNIGSEHSISTNDKYNRCSFSFRSESVVQSLLDLGITEKKSLTLSPRINKIPAHLHRHFWRGVIDGDGYIGKRVVTLVGSYDMVIGFINFSACDSKIKKTGNIYRVDIYGRKAIYAVREIYRDSNVFMERKNRSAKLFMENFNARL